MKPGRELDALVAEKVMGWKLVQTETGAPASPSDYELAALNDGWHWEGDSVNREAWEFTPSTNIAAAWEVVEKIAPAGNGEFRVERDESGEWECEIGYHVAEACYPRIAKGETAPHAICLAALAVKK